MEIVVKAATFEVKADLACLNAIHNEFSFTDKQIEHLLKRHIKSCKWRESTGKTFPGYPEWKAKRTHELESKLIVFCGVIKEDILELPIGLLSRITQAYPDTKIIDQRDFDLIRKPLKGELPRLRYYQTEAIQKAIEASFGLLRLSVGTGKTVIGQELIRHYQLSSIFLVPSKQILKQTYERFRGAFGRRNVAAYGDGKKEHAQVTVATYQSVFNATAEEFSRYRLMIADECHHIGADTFFEVSHNRLQECVYRFGLTADEERADGGTILVEAAVGPLLYSYDTPQAIAEGHLAKPTFVVYEVEKTEGTYTQWETKDNKRYAVGINESYPYLGDDAHDASKNWIVGNDYLCQKVGELAKGFLAANKSVLILVDEKEHGEKLLLSLPDETKFVHSSNKDNETIVAAFNRREIKGIVATSVLSEGADTVPVDVLINLMGGKRPKQANGRALRNDVDENGIARKPECLIIDFDFPRSPVLRFHCEARCEVHRSCGPVFRLPLAF